MKRILILSLILLFGITAYSKSPIKTDYILPSYLNAEFDEHKFDTKEIIGYINTNGKTKYVDMRFAPKSEPMLLDEDLTGTYITPDGIEIVNLVQLATPGDNGNQSETWIAVNPTNPNNAVATCNFQTWSHKMTAYYTHDGGKTWAMSKTDNHSKLISGGSTTIFDPAIDFNSKGELLYVYGYTAIGKDNLGNEIHPDGGIYMSNSSDGGKTWRQFTDPNDPLGAIQYAQNSPSVFNDRYTIAVDKFSNNDDTKDNLYVGWQMFAGGSAESGVHVATSGSYDDYFESMDSKVSADGAGTQAPVPAVGPEGEVYVSWRQTISNEKTKTPVSMSTDGGFSYENKTTMFDVYTLGEKHPEGNRHVLSDKDNMRISSNPILSVDCTPEGSSSRGNVYGIIAAKTSGSASAANRLWFAKSTDQAESWEVKKIDNASNGGDIFFPNIDVDPVTGYIHVFYYSSEFDNSNEKADAFYAISKDEGNSFKHFRLSNKSFGVKAVGQSGEIDNRYWGDYAGIAAYGNKVYPLWWMPTSTAFHYNSVDLFAAIITTAPLPPFPINHEKGDEIFISWSNLIKDGVGDPVNEFTIELWKNNELLKTFEKGVVSYIDKDVNIGDEVTYKLRTVSKDVRGAGDFHEFSVKVGGSIEPMNPTNLSVTPADNGLVFTWENPTQTVEGGDFTFFSGIKIFIDGEEVAEVEGNNISETNDYMVYNLELSELDKYYTNLSISVLGKREDEVQESKNNPVVEYAYAGPISSGFANSFEEEYETYPKYEFGETQWRTTDAKAAEGTYCLTDSEVGVDYEPELNDGLILAPFKLDGDNLYLHWKYIALVHKTDHAAVELSKDHGQTWIAAKWMNETASPLFEGDLANAEWLKTGLNLPDYGFEAGDVVYVKIKIVTNFGLHSDGIYLDDFVLNNVKSVSPLSVQNTKVFPNPVKSNVNINFELSTAGMTRFEVYNMLGNKVEDLGSEFLTVGQNNKQYNFSELSNGTYYLRISQNESSESIPFVIQK